MYATKYPTSTRGYAGPTRGRRRGGSRNARVRALARLTLAVLGLMIYGAWTRRGVVEEAVRSAPKTAVRRFSERVEASKGELGAYARAHGVGSGLAMTPKRLGRARRELVLASHGALLALDVDTRATRTLHVGRGVYYGAFVANDADADVSGRAVDGATQSGRYVWVASRPDEAGTQKRRKDALLLIDTETQSVLKDVPIDAVFTHDVVRRGSQVFVADTGGGRVLELEYPSMTLKRSIDSITKREHINTLVPADESEYGPHAVWGVLHNLGPSQVALYDLELGKEVKSRMTNVGEKSHGLVPYKGKFLMLNSGKGQLILVDPAASDDAPFDVLWEDPKHTFMKGLCVVDDVAYFGVSIFGNRRERVDPDKTSDVIAFDLLKNELRWRTTVQTKGLLNIVTAPSTSESGGTWQPTSWGDRPTLHEVDAVLTAPTAPTALYSKWIDISTKAKHNRPTDKTQVESILKIYKDIDVSALKDYLEQLPKGAFDLVNQKDNARLGGRKANADRFKPNCASMHLIFSDRQGQQIYEFPYWKKFESLVRPLLEELFVNQLGVGSDYLRHIIRLQLAVMYPDSKILEHVDSGQWATANHRFHIPIVVPSTYDATEFTMLPGGKNGGEQVDVPLVEGRPFEINNAIPHRVRNDADSWRIHLLIDYAELPVPPANRHTLSPGAVCSYNELSTGKCVEDELEV